MLEIQIDEKQEKKHKTNKYDYFSRLIIGISAGLCMYIGYCIYTSYQISFEAEKHQKFENDYKYYMLEAPIQGTYSELDMKRIIKELIMFNQEVYSFSINHSAYKFDNFHSAFKDAKDMYVNNEVSLPYKEVYENTLKLRTLPYSLTIQTNIGLMYNKAEKIGKHINESNLSSKDKEIYNKELNKLMLAYKNLKILDVYKKNQFNQDFKNIVRSKNYQQLWDTYFKQDFGSEINPIIYLDELSF